MGPPSPRPLSSRQWLRDLKHRFAYLLESPRARTLEVKIEALMDMQMAHQRQVNMLLRELTMPDSSLWAGGVKDVDANAVEGPAPLLLSSVCRQASLESGAYRRWMKAIEVDPIYHRKHWEFAFVLQALEERGAIQPGSRGLGFGVGEERLTAYFANRGCKITATDIGADQAVDAGWAESSQYAAGKESLRYPRLCPDEVFDANVQFRNCDMNAVPDDLKGYDFCWSACAFEHLGSIEKGLAFVERSLDCLKPGGWAVHTTEYNLSSNTDTIERGDTVLFRQRDFQELERRVTENGATMATLDLIQGGGALDKYIDLPPFRREPHMALALDGYVATSAGLIIQAPLAEAC